MDLAAWSVSHFVRFLLVLSRLGGVFLITPLLGGRLVPGRIRLLLAVALSLAVFPVVETASVSLPESWVVLLRGIGGEVGVGLVCGFVVNIVFIAAQMAGVILSRHMGTALAEVLNPLHESPLPILGKLFYALALVVFVAVNGHHVLLAGLVRTFERLPLLQVSFDARVVGTMSGLMGDMFVLMIRLAAPALVALFLVTIAMGMIARTMPQVNVLVTGFPLQVCVGLVVTTLSLGAVAVLLSTSFVWITQQMDVVLRFLVPR